MSRAIFAACAAGAFAGCSATLAPTRAECLEAQHKTPFNPAEFKPFRLLSSSYESHDCRRFVFALDNPDEKFGLPVSSCIVCKFTDADGKDVIRPYTPLTVNGTKGHFTLLIKRYPKSKMGNHLFTMRPGETLDMKGPYVKFDYKPNKWKHIGMIAGGTGITPVYQVIRCVLDNPADKTLLSLIYGNNARKDILMAQELCDLQKVYANFHMYLKLVDPPKKWLGGVGYVNKDEIKAFMPKPGDDKTMVLVCGPPPFMKAVSGDKDFSGGTPKQGELAGMLKDMGYTADQVFKF